MEKNEFRPYFILHIEMNEKWLTDLNIRVKTIHILEKQVRINPYNFGLGEKFLDLTPKAQSIWEKKVDKLDLSNFFLKLVLQHKKDEPYTIRKYF